MKFRLNIGIYYGELNPVLSGGRSYGMKMVPWIKAVREEFDFGLKDAKSLADHLRASIESGSNLYRGASVVVDAIEFPFLNDVRHWTPPNSLIEVIDDRNTSEYPHDVCTRPITDDCPVQVIKDALCKLVEIDSWNGVRRLAEVLMDIENDRKAIDQFTANAIALIKNA